jgi:hypothetical protein
LRERAAQKRDAPADYYTTTAAIEQYEPVMHLASTQHVKKM